jgi:MoaA/NifB/PqqE/SkfB family radical SAM enzyme
VNIPHKKFCVLPWISLEASPIGTVRPCCLAEHEITDSGGDKFNLATATFAKIQNSHNMRKLRQQFIDGDEPETCRKCWNEERAGRTSKRMHTLDRLKHVIPPQDWTIDAKPIMFLDLKLGNICNLKCRICGSWSSSTFAAEELKHDGNNKNSFHYQMLRQGAWPKENKVFWNEIDGVATQIRYLEFTGGEPFMIQEHFDMLQGLVVRGLAPNIEIHYNTNGTHWPEDAIEIWRHFKTVEVAFSIDDIGARFEYQRSNARWSEVQENIDRFKELRVAYPNIQLQVCSTVNVFNVYYLEDVANWIDTQEFDFVYWNMMHDAPYFSVANLPPTAKKAIVNRLITAPVSQKHKTEFANIIDFINNGKQDMSQLMLEKIRELDIRRKENLAQVEPEFATLIGYEATT